MRQIRDPLGPFQKKKPEERERREETIWSRTENPRKNPKTLFWGPISPTSAKIFPFVVFSLCSYLPSFRLVWPMSDLEKRKWDMNGIIRRNKKPFSGFSSAKKAPSTKYPPCRKISSAEPLEDPRSQPLEIPNRWRGQPVTDEMDLVGLAVSQEGMTTSLDSAQVNSGSGTRPRGEGDTTGERTGDMIDKSASFDTRQSEKPSWDGEIVQKKRISQKRERRKSMKEKIQSSDRSKLKYSTERIKTPPLMREKVSIKPKRGVTLDPEDSPGTPSEARRGSNDTLSAINLMKEGDKIERVKKKKSVEKTPSRGDSSGSVTISPLTPDREELPCKKKPGRLGRTKSWKDDKWRVKTVNSFTFRREMTSPQPTNEEEKETEVKSPKLEKEKEKEKEKRKKIGKKPGAIDFGRLIRQSTMTGSVYIYRRQWKRQWIFLSDNSSSYVSEPNFTLRSFKGICEDTYQSSSQVSMSIFARIKFAKSPGKMKPIKGSCLHMISETVPSRSLYLWVEGEGLDLWFVHLSHAIEKTKGRKTITTPPTILSSPPLHALARSSSASPRASIRFETRYQASDSPPSFCPLPALSPSLSPSPFFTPSPPLPLALPSRTSPTLQSQESSSPLDSPFTEPENVSLSPKLHSNCSSSPPSTVEKWRYHNRLILDLREAKNLPHSKTEPRPYVVALAFGVRLRCKNVCLDGRAPFWGEEMCFDLPRGCAPQPDTIRLYLMNEAKGKELVGEASLNLEPIREADGPTRLLTPLQCVDSKAHVDGELQVFLQTIPSHYLAHRPPSDAQFFLDRIGSFPSYLWIQISQLRHFIAPRSPHSDLVIRFQIGKKRFRTNRAARGANFMFCEHFIIGVDPANFSSPKDVMNIQFAVFGQPADPLAPQEICYARGSLFLTEEFFQLDQSFPTEYLVGLYQPNIKLGENETRQALAKLQIGLSWNVFRILPKSFYLPLFELLIKPPYAGTIVASRAVADSTDSFCSHLVPLLLEEENTLHFFSILCQDEVRSTNHSDILFRGNSLFTKSMDHLQKIICGPYLFTIIRPWMKDLCGEKACLELDPLRVDKPDDIHLHRVRLLARMQSLLDLIFQSSGCVPPLLRFILADIRKQVMAKFSGESVQYTCLSSLFFLRLVCPCLLTPFAYGVMDQPPPANTIRSLTLMTKVIQNMANLAEFGDKEAFMELLNPFLVANFARMRVFLDSLCRPALSIPPLPRIMRTKDSEFHFASIYQLLRDKIDELKELVPEDSEEEERKTRLIAEILVLNDI